MEELLQKLSEHNLIDELGNIIWERYENGTCQVIEPVTFQTFYGDKPFDYENLIGSHTFIWADGETYTRTATELGHAPFFEEWHALGII